MPEPMTFAAPVLSESGGMRMHFVPLPAEVAEAYAGVRRVVVAFDGVTVRRAILPRAGGERYLALSHDLMRSADLAYGQTVIVDLRPDPEPDRIDLGELADALAADDAARDRWEAMTLGRQRSLAHYVTSAKRGETRAARAEEIAHKLSTHTLYGDLHPPS